MAFSTYLMGGLGGLGALLAFCAVALPSSRRVERSGFVPAAPEQVFQLLSSTDGFQSFNPHKDDEPDLEITPFGPSSGVGAGFGFVGKSTTGTQTISALEANRKVTMEIDLGSMGRTRRQEAHRTYRLARHRASLRRPSCHGAYLRIVGRARVRRLSVRGD